MLNNIKKFLHLETSKMKWIDNLLTEYGIIFTVLAKLKNGKIKLPIDIKP